jgi:hypothetical protein
MARTQQQQLCLARVHCIQLRSCQVHTAYKLAPRVLHCMRCILWILAAELRSPAGTVCTVGLPAVLSSCGGRVGRLLSCWHWAPSLLSCSRRTSLHWQQCLGYRCTPAPASRCTTARLHLKTCSVQAYEVADVGFAVYVAATVAVSDKQLTLAAEQQWNR